MYEIMGWNKTRTTYILKDANYNWEPRKWLVLSINTTLQNASLTALSVKIHSRPMRTTYNDSEDPN